ncbi:MAG TPA: hypothetical protein VFE47_26950 [Tepidisphaeraceae bacterium]|jgi:hypothetical protein|nr:hypothetical protein [Tepidisphaeraceae bacterium]
MSRRLIGAITVLSLVLFLILVELFVLSYSGIAYTISLGTREVIALRSQAECSYRIDVYEAKPPWIEPATGWFRFAVDRYPSFKVGSPGEFRFLVTTAPQKRGSFLEPPEVGHALIFPQWVVIVIFSILPALYLRTRRRNRKRRTFGQCPQCDYDLRASIGRCPECGTAT